MGQVPGLPRRVLMTADAAGGVWTYALELARGLAARGIDTALAVMGAALEPDQRCEARGLQVLEGPFKLEWMDDPWEDVRQAGDWLLALEERLRPDIVHLNGYVHGALPWRAPKLIAGHSCVLSWWRAVHGEDAPPSWNTYREKVREGLRAATLVIAPTHAMLESLIEHYGPLARTRVIHNGRDPGLFAPAIKEQLIFAAGRAWDHAKNLETLASIRDRLPWPVHIAGAGTHPLGRLSHVEVRGWLARASIYALPARYEPFGLSILEAALSGCALVIGDIPSLREIWGNAAMFVPPDSPDALHSALMQLIADPERLACMARRARARAAGFSAARMAAEYVAAYSAS